MTDQDDDRSGGGTGSPILAAEDRARLAMVLERSRQLGYIGSKGSIDDHIDHALGFARVVGDLEGGQALDLGSGGGLPGLVLALCWPRSRWALLDAQQRRVECLEEAIDALALDDRVVAVHARAEDAGQDDLWRHSFDLVTSRSFGPPALVAECAAGFLRVGGTLVVSEPPGEVPGRWPTDGLAQLGLVTIEGGDGRFQACLQRSPAPDRYPRRSGIPGKRLLF